VCRSQQALLKVLSKVDNKSSSNTESIHQSTAWCDDQHKITKSVSSIVSIDSDSSVMGVRNSRSAGSLKERVSGSKHLSSGDLEMKSHGMKPNRNADRRRAAHSQSPAGGTSRSAVDHAVERTVDTGIRSSRSGAVTQAGSGRSQRRPITVRVELLSNWGHERFVGLTEIELLDRNERRIDVSPLTDVTVSALSSVSQVDALFNGKCKVYICSVPFVGAVTHLVSIVANVIVCSTGY